jgi:hypothetical protein
VKAVNKETGEKLPYHFQNKSNEPVQAIVEIGPGEKLTEKFVKSPIGEPRQFKSTDNFSFVFQMTTQEKIMKLNDAERSLWMLLSAFLDYDCFVKKDNRFISKGMVSEIMGWNRKKAYAALESLHREQIIAYVLIGTHKYIMVNPLFILRGNTSEIEHKTELFKQAFCGNMSLG